MARVRRAQITWKGPTGQVYTLTLDASVRETHTSASTVTDHPVERGSNVADHIRPDPDELSIDGVISNTPHFLPADHVGAIVLEERQVKGAEINASDTVTSTPLGNVSAGLLGSTIPLPTALLGRIGTGRFETALTQGFSGEFDRVTECYKELLRIRAEGQLTRILTTLRAYDNMALTTLEVVREAASGNSLNLSLQFKNVRFGATKNEPVPTIPVTKKEQGTKTKEEHSEDTDSTSALRLWFNKGR